MQVCMCTCMHACVHVCLHVCVCACMCVHARTHMYALRSVSMDKILRSTNTLIIIMITCPVVKAPSEGEGERSEDLAQHQHTHNGHILPHWRLWFLHMFQQQSEDKCLQTEQIEDDDSGAINPLSK